MRWNKGVQTNATGWDGWSEHICSPLWQTDGAMWAKKNGHVKDTSPRLLTWHACQGYQIVRGKDGSRTKKKKEGTVLSQAGRARHMAEPSVRSRHRDCFVCATACWWARNEIHRAWKSIFSPTHPEVEKKLRSESGNHVASQTAAGL